MGKAVAPFIFIRIYRNGTQTDSPLPGIQYLSILGKEIYLHLIKRLITITMRPPELRIRNGNAELFFCSFALLLVFIRFSIGRSYLNGKGSFRLIGKGLYGNVKIQCYRTFFMDLCYVN